MPYLIAAVVFTTLLGLLNLLLLFGVIRRLREDAAKTSVMPDLSDVQVGDPVPDFAAVTTDGVEVSQAGPPDRLIAFFATDCSACHDQLPGFRTYARRAGGRDRVVAVVAGPAEQTPTMVTMLADVASVVREPLRGPVGRAFGVSAYPVVFQLTGDRIGAVVISVDSLPAPAAR